MPEQMNETCTPAEDTRGAGRSSMASRIPSDGRSLPCTRVRWPNAGRVGTASALLRAVLRQPPRLRWMTSGDDLDLLRHHGDVDAVRGLVDFAVNVRVPRPPEWLRERLVAAMDRLGEYPSAAADRAARAAAAARHGRAPDEVMVLSGAAEGFALLSALRPHLAAVIHPSFTEPEVALRSAGVPVTRVGLDPAEGFRLVADRVPPEADLVVLGNPTNPTSVLHPVAEIQRLLRPGRVVVVDEAFADTVPGEPESVASWSEPGLLVLRSLTKMWGLSGLRAGYVLGDPRLLAGLQGARPHWPVGTLVLEAVTACCEPGAVDESARAAEEIVRLRDGLCRELDTIDGVSVVRPAAASYLLVRVDNGAKVRNALIERGIAVRRADTFPGLDADYFRVAVRGRADNAMLTTALRDIVGQ